MVLWASTELTESVKFHFAKFNTDKLLWVPLEPPETVDLAEVTSSRRSLRACAIDSCVSVRCLLSGGNARTQKKFSQKNSKKKFVTKC